MIDSFTNWAALVAKSILYVLIGAGVFMIITWGIIINQSANIVEDRLADLVYIVSEENCLSTDGTSFEDSPAGTFEKLLEASETDWLSFKTHSRDGANFDYTGDANGISYYVGSSSGHSRYMSYLDAPQRGDAIIIKVRGYIELPMIISPFAASEAEANDNRLKVRHKIEKTYVTTGLKFFKDRD